MPASVRRLSGRYNVAFIAAIAHSIAWPDTGIVECFCAGFPIVGICPPSGVPSFITVTRPEHTPDITTGNAGWNRALHGRVSSDFKSGRSPHARVLWDKTVKEVESGLCSGPYTLAWMDEKFGRDGWRAMLRFPVEQTADTHSSARAADNIFCE